MRKNKIQKTSTEKAGEVAVSCLANRGIHDRLFVPENPADIAKFRRCCEELWKELHDKDLKHWNNPYFHSCCMVFSKKNYSKGKHYHPKESTYDFLTWLNFHKVQNQEQFAAVLLREVIARKDGVYRIPGLNMPHNADYPVEQSEKRTQELIRPLEKRVLDLEGELITVKKENTNLKRKLKQIEQQLQDQQAGFESTLRRWKKEGRLINLKPADIFGLEKLPKFGITLEP